MLPLRHSFTAIVAGPTSCGKTRFVFRLIDHVSRMIDPPPSKAVYYYGVYQQLFCQYSRVIFHQGLPELNEFDGKESLLLIIDDLMQETNDTVANLFTKGSHYRNVSVVHLAQNLFPKNKFARTMSLNAHYMVAVWCSGSALVTINVVILHWARLVLGWVRTPFAPSRF